MSTTFEEVGDILRGVTYDKTNSYSAYETGLVPIVRATNIQGGHLDCDSLVYVSPTCVGDQQLLREGDMVIATSSGSASVVGKAARAGVQHSGMAFGAFCGVVRPALVDLSDWITKVFETSEYRGFVKGVAMGTNINNLRPRDLQKHRFPLPPAAEQLRIVAKLDVLTARFVRARVELNRVSALANNLRRSTLSQAFAGKLTRSMRSLEDPISVKGYPTSWTVCELGQISEIQGGVQVGKKRNSVSALIDTPYLRVANVQRGWLRLHEIKTIGVTREERDRLLLRSGDILMNEGGDRDKLGRGWVWRDEVPGCIHQNHVFRIRLLIKDFPPEFVSHFANEFGQQYFIDQGTQTTNLASISKRKVAALQVPVPPTDEAKEIVRFIDAAFARADRLEAEAGRARALLDRLESAILAKAFRGELVPQDPNDEPASVLLDRIGAERAAALKTSRGRKKKEIIL